MAKEDRRRKNPTGLTSIFDRSRKKTTKHAKQTFGDGTKNFRIIHISVLWGAEVFWESTTLRETRLCSMYQYRGKGGRGGGKAVCLIVVGEKMEDVGWVLLLSQRRREKVQLRVPFTRGKRVWIRRWRRMEGFCSYYVERARILYLHTA